MDETVAVVLILFGCLFLCVALFLCYRVRAMHLQPQPQPLTDTDETSSNSTAPSSTPPPPPPKRKRRKPTAKHHPTPPVSDTEDDNEEPLPATPKKRELSKVASPPVAEPELPTPDLESFRRLEARLERLEQQSIVPFTSPVPSSPLRASGHSASPPPTVMSQNDLGDPVKQAQWQQMVIREMLESGAHPEVTVLPV